jgi:hypothetical protein
MLSLCRDKAATMHAIANTGATLMLGQERSREETALAVDPRRRSHGISSAEGMLVTAPLQEFLALATTLQVVLR